MPDDRFFDLPKHGLVLFHTARSYCAQQARLVLEEKGLDWESRYLELGKAEHFHPAYVRMNPHMVVPTLVDNGRIIRDAARIIRYVDLRYPEPALTPTLPVLKRQMEHWIDQEDVYPVKYLSIGNLPDDLRNRQLAGWQARLSALESYKQRYRFDRPLCALYDRKIAEISEWQTVEADKPQLRDIRDRMEHLLDELERQLLSTGFLAGDDYTLADLAWTPVLYRIEECGLASYWSEGRRPKLADYVERLKQRPSFQRAIADFLSGRRR